MQTTSFARLTPVQAKIVLGIVALALIAGVGVTLSPLSSTNYDPGRTAPGDASLYRAIVDRIHDGEGYYPAAAAEMTARGYPTRSVFNWRPPLHMWLLGKMPSPVIGMAMLGAMALLLMLMAFEAMAREEDGRRADGLHPQPLAELEKGVRGISRRERGTGLRPLGCILLLTGALLPTILGDLYVMPSLWAGVLIALSICAYGIDRPWLGVMLGLAAIFFRELALPYCLVCVALAWRRKQVKELAVWLLGLSVWMMIYGIHCWSASRWIAPDAIAHQQGWIQFGGAGFVISTVQMNAYLLLLPQWITAIYLVAALVGMAGWNTPMGERIGLSACLFLTVFAVVGHGFNQYWGMLIAPLMCFGVARFPASLCDLYKAAGFRRPMVDSSIY